MTLIDGYRNRPSALRDLERGRRCFILGNGPSVREERLDRLDGELVIGMNASTILEEEHGFRSSYYTVSDRRFLAAEDRREWGTTRLSQDTRRVVRADLRGVDDPALAHRTTYVAPLARNGFSNDLSNGFFYGCTTTMLAIQLAWHLGCREVYLLGCDLRYAAESPRFYDEHKPQVEDNFTSVQIHNIVNAARIFEDDGGLVAGCSARSFLRPYLPYRSFASLVTA